MSWPPGTLRPTLALFWYLALALLLASALPAMACAPQIVDNPPGQGTPWSPPLRLLAWVDTGATHSAGDVAALPDDVFTPVQGPVNAGGGDAVWLRLCLARTPDTAEHWVLTVLPPYLDQVTLYPSDWPNTEAQTQGSTLPFALRAWSYRGFTFPLHLAEVGSPTAPLHLRLYAQLGVGADVLLLPPAGLARLISAEYALFGLYLGMLLLVVAINTMFWLRLRQAIHLRYALSSLAVACFATLIGGYADQFLLPAAPALARELTSASYSAAAALFSRFLLLAFRTGLYYRRLHRLLQLSALVFAVNAALAFSPWRLAAEMLSDVLLLALLPPLVVTSLHAALRHRPIRLYALALLPLQLGLLLTMARNFGLSVAIPLADHLPIIGTVVHLVLLNLALARGAWRAQQGRQRAQAAALRAARKAEQELESRVAQRTTELDRSNARLREEIAQREAVEQHLQQALNAKLDALQMQRQFLSMVSHEFRTPLAVIDAAAQHLDSEAVDTGQRERAQRIRRGVTRMSDLLENFLTEERMDASTLRPQCVATDLGGLLHRRYGAGRGSPRLTLALPGHPVTAQVDPHLLGIAINNLVDNALKYSDSRETVLITLSATPLHAMVEVTDRGDGVAAADQAHLFDKYFRSDSARNRPGAGLGLHLCRELARLHGGDVALIWSTLGGGSCFRLWLPLRPGPAQDCAADPDSGPRVGE